MWEITPQWLAALSKSHGRYTRMEAWYQGVKVTDIPVSGGSVAVTARNRIRRTLTAYVAESWWPTSATDPLAPYGQRVKVFQGITGADGSLIGSEVPVFSGRVEAPDRQRKSGMVTVTALDPFADINDSQFEAPRVIPAGALVVSAIQDLVSEVIPHAPFLDLTGSLAVLPAAMNWDTDRGQAVDDLAASIGAEVFFRPDETCVLRPVPTLTGIPVWSLVQGQNSTIVRDVMHRSRTDVANRIVVHVEQPGADPLTWVVSDADAASPTRYGGPYGKVVRNYSNALITSIEQAELAGQARLARSLGITRQRQIDSVPNPALEAGDVLAITTDEGPERHISDSFTLPFAVTDVMSTQTRSTGTSID